MPETPVRTHITETSISRLARDIARDLTNTTDLLKVHQLTLAQYEYILGTKIFQIRLEEEIAAWAGDGRGRIAAKAMAILEEGLLELFDLIHDKAVATPAKIDALRFAAKLAAMEDGAVEINTDERVVFNITIGGRKSTFVDQRADPKVIEGEVTQMGNSVPAE